MSWKTERHRGLKEAQQQFAVLSARWPQAFPEKPQLVRPLSSEIVPVICQELGWTIPYARTVLDMWKRRRSYCNAVLCYRDRIRLDGSPTGEQVADDARAAAKADLQRMATARAARDARALAKQQAQEASQAA